MNAMIWLILFVVLVVFEIATMGLTTIWLSLIHISEPTRH